MGFEVKCISTLDKMVCCCCSCTLKSATIILGWLGLIGDILQFVTFIVNIAYFDQARAQPPYDSKEALIGGVVTSALGVLVCALLLYGAHKEKPTFMLPYIILGIIGIIGGLVIVVVFSIILFVHAIVAGLILLFVGGFVIALAAYFWVVVYSYYRQLVESQNPQPGAPLDSFVVAGKQNEQYQFPYHNQGGQETA